MKIDRKDLLPLRLPVVALLASLALTVWLIDNSANRRASEIERLREARVKADEATTRFHDSDLERDVIAQYLPRYRALEQRGFIGSENRANWIDALRIADQQAGRFGVQYQLSAQGPYKGMLSAEPIATRLRSSTMNISFGLVHEGQFLTFLDVLETQRAGMFALRACSLEPVHKDQPQPKIRNLTAACQIDWVTLLPPGAEQS
jgi:hypothetical protein